jgi:hypothetical protein
MNAKAFVFKLRRIKQQRDYMINLPEDKMIEKTN